jgi:hypothetical protein
LPLTKTAVLLDFHATDGWPRTFTLFHDPDQGLILLHRQGQSVARHSLPCNLQQLAGTGRLSLRFDAPARHWEMRFELLGGALGGPSFHSCGMNPMPLRPTDLAALSAPEHRAHRHSAVLWFGLTRGANLPARAPWIAQRTPVDTLRGPVLAGNLLPGDLIRATDGALVPLRQIIPLNLPTCGTFAPVILRAPYFGQTHDLLVSADQCIALSGPEVEYLFNEEEILAEAATLIDGRTTLNEHRRPEARTLRLEFDQPTLISADGCALLAAAPDDIPPRRMLQGYEVLTLMALLGRAGHRRVA